MALKSIHHDQDGLKVGILKDWRLNPLTSAEIVSLASTLNSSHVGLTVWDSTISKQQTWNGTAFTDSNSIAGALAYKGAVAFGATEPVSPVTGDFYKFTTAGSNTWAATAVDVKVGDEVYYDGTDWEFIKNESSVSATDTIPGVVELSTNAEALTGTDTGRVLTPANLASVITSKQLARVYFNGAVVLTANTPATVNHNLALSNRNAFTINVMETNSGISIDYDSTDVNNITLTSNIATTVAVCIIGF